MGSQFIAGAKVAVVVLGDREVTDAWCEDASLAAVTMQYQYNDSGTLKLVNIVVTFHIQW